MKITKEMQMERLCKFGNFVAWAIIVLGTAQLLVWAAELFLNIHLR